MPASCARPPTGSPRASVAVAALAKPARPTEQAMLMQRIATAVVLVPLVVAGVLLLPTFWVALIFAALLVVGAWEWARFPGAVTRPARALFAAMYVLC